MTTPNEPSQVTERDADTLTEAEGCVAVLPPPGTPREIVESAALLPNWNLLRLLTGLTLLAVAGTIITLVEFPTKRFIIGTIGGGLIASLLLWLVPKWQVSGLGSLKPDAFFQQENEARRTLAQIIGGAVVLAGLYYTSENVKLAQKSTDETQKAATESRELTRQAQITDRFTKAIEELGKEDTPGKANNLAMRLGGIYALERIANESEQDHWPIIELLISYINQHATRQEKGSGVTPEVQAIITALGRRKVEFEVPSQRLVLGNLDLSRAYFTGNLNGVFFDRSNLTGATFDKTQLSGGSFVNTNLTLARFKQVNMRGAVFNSASFSETRTELSLTAFIDSDMSDTAGLVCKDLETARISEKTTLPGGLANCDIKRTEFVEYYRGVAIK
jgi:hypothetical protein